MVSPVDGEIRRVFTAMVIVILLAIWLVACVIESRRQLHAWSGEIPLWHHATIAAPTEPRAWLNYGSALFNRSDPGDMDAAAGAWSMAIKLAMADHIRPKYRRLVFAVAAQNLARVAWAEGRREDGNQWMIQAYDALPELFGQHDVDFRADPSTLTQDEIIFNNDPDRLIREAIAIHSIDLDRVYRPDYPCFRLIAPYTTVRVYGPAC